MRRKIICLALAACLACGTLGGCSSDPSSYPTSLTVNRSDISSISLDENEFHITAEELREKINELLPEGCPHLAPLMDDSTKLYSHVSRELSFTFEINPRSEFVESFVIHVIGDWNHYQAYIDAITTIIDPETTYDIINRKLQLSKDFVGYFSSYRVKYSRSVTSSIDFEPFPNPPKNNTSKSPSSSRTPSESSSISGSSNLPEEPSTASSTSDAKEIPISKEIDWDECISQTKEEITDPQFFSYVKDVEIIVDSDEKQITLSAVVSDATDPTVALDYADTMVRRLNAWAQMQDGSIKSSSKNYYGGIYDEYSAMVGVAPLSKVKDTDKWFVYDVIAKGGKNKLKLNKAYR